MFGRNVCQMKFNLELSLDILYYKSFIGQGKQKNESLSCMILE